MTRPIRFSGVRALLVGVVLALGLVASGCQGGAGARAPASRATRIDWRRFGAEALEQARQSNRMVFIDVGIEGCTACRWMHEDTYRDAEVIRRVSENFVAVSVDADVEPDLGSRYERWGWPATIVLNPRGEQVFALRGNVRPRRFVPMLDELILRHKAGKLLPDEATTSAAPADSGGDLGALCVQRVTGLERIADRRNGGWGRSDIQDIDAPAVAQAFLRAHTFGEKEEQAQALRTLEGYAKLLDPVWGGVYVASLKRDFSEPVVEKRILMSAGVLQGFADAYHVTGDARWVERAAEVHRHLRDFMLAPDGTFYSTQRDEAPDLPETLTAEEYFKLGDQERRRYGVPAVDHGRYTDQNGILIEAYVKLYEATGDKQWLAVATKAAAALIEERTHPEGFLRQVAPDQGVTQDSRLRAFQPREDAYLAPQGRFGYALVALYNATGEERWLKAAEGVARALRAKLEDPQAGGFFGSTRPPLPGTGPARFKPLEENIAAARFLLALHRHRPDPQLERSVERTLAAMPQREPFNALYALALEEFLLGPVDFSVAGSPDDPNAAALFEAAVRAYEPRKVVHYDHERRYPRGPQAALYVCTKQACSSPVRAPAAVKEVASRFARVDARAPCASPGERRAE